MTYQPELLVNEDAALQIGSIIWMTTDNLDDHDNDENVFPNLQQGNIEFDAVTRTQTVELSASYLGGYTISLSPDLGTVLVRNQNSFTIEADTGFNGIINWQTLGDQSKRLSDNWFPCDGRSLSTIDYNILFSKLGYTYGGSGNTFNLPDLTGRYIVGESIEENLVFGAYGGETTHQLIPEELPQHRHFFRDYYMGYRGVSEIIEALSIIDDDDGIGFLSDYYFQYPKSHDQVRTDAFGNPVWGAGLGYRVDNDNVPYSFVWNRTAGFEGTPWSENEGTTGASARFASHLLKNASGPWGSPPFGGKGGGNDVAHYNIGPYLTLKALIRYK